VHPSPDAANGTTCGGDTDCQSGHCVEGVCCDGACTGKCLSCRNTNTGQAEGKCAAVKVGLAHASDCAASDPTTCGFDGKCDGAGACRRFVAGTSCAVESCADGATSTYTPARTCNGMGTCTAATPSSCGTYRCGGTKCKTACAGTGAADCLTSAYCSGVTCLAKKGDGALCASGTECANGVCGGRCCAAGCSCTQPNAANVLTNPGFDADTTGWTTDSGTLSRSTLDAEQCPYSGSLTTTMPAGAPERIVGNCAAARSLNGNFNFGLQIRVEGAGQALCEARFWQGQNCDGNEVIDNQTLSTMPVSGWQSPPPESGAGTTLPVAGANSVRFSCYLFSATTNPTTFYIDMAYVSLDPHTY
jgi:hypothetical protein